MRARCILLALIAVLALAGCVRNPAVLAPAPDPAGPYVLDSGDKLRVVVFGQDGLSNSYAVDASGKITMPLIGQVPARGLTTVELTQSVAAKLQQGYVREPHVAVEVEAYRPFFVLGEVLLPGQFPFVPNLTAEGAVAIAGGFSPRGLRGPVELHRPVEGGISIGSVPLNYPVRPGDTIVVSERWF
jgi:polysaccharide export outer membrane protein